MPKKRYYDKMKSKQEGGMIASGPLGIALMPTNVVMKYYPKDGSYLPENLNDGITGVDSQKKADVSKTKSELSKTKF